MRYFPPAILDRKIRFALVGCGRIAANHFNAISQHAARCELVGVCDVNPDALAAAAQQTGARPYRNLADMLARSDADAYVIATPSGRDDNADIIVHRQHATHGIGWRAEINGHIELAQDSGKPVAKIDRNAIQQKCCRLQ